MTMGERPSVIYRTYLYGQNIKKFNTKYDAATCLLGLDTLVINSGQKNTEIPQN